MAKATDKDKITRRSKVKEPQGRGRLSSIDGLPEDLRVELNTALRERRLTQREIVDHLNALLAKRGAKPLSKSSVHRYATQIEKKIADRRAAQQAAEAIVGGLGEARDGDIGRALTEIVKTMAMDVALNAGEDGEPVSPELLADLALTIRRLEAAASVGIDRELKIRKSVLTEIEAKAKEQADDVAASVRKAGLSDEAAQAIREKFLGIARDG